MSATRRALVQQEQAVHSATQLAETTALSCTHVSERAEALDYQTSTVKVQLNNVESSLLMHLNRLKDEMASNMPAQDLASQLQIFMQQLQEKCTQTGAQVAEEVAYLYALFDVSRPEVHEIVDRAVGTNEKVALLHRAPAFAPLVQSIARLHTEIQDAEQRTCSRITDANTDAQVKLARKLASTSVLDTTQPKDAPTVHDLFQHATKSLSSALAASDAAAMRTTTGGGAVSTPAVTPPIMATPPSTRHRARGSPTPRTVTTMGLDVKDTEVQVTEDHTLPGVQVTVVRKGGPAAAAGVQANDIVISVDGTAVTSRSQFKSLVRSFKPGTTVRCTVCRDGWNKQTLSITLAALMESPASNRKEATLADVAAKLPQWQPGLLAEGLAHSWQ
eukprot:NODE_1565_length_1292_cov_67.780258_g1551_i0.p1 GENE.NODE_1565_length_1292_cov_67.780258_g1551_i0~~NODE_1565_length_1292_cov_67.780258_g1551_i0.p1  ORF type:complete len:405 (+),score=108.32 NODE_1565_length_1292_cov_67.780258_g1551_i0:51-1217(+)